SLRATAAPIHRFDVVAAVRKTRSTIEKRQPAAYPLLTRSIERAWQSCQIIIDNEQDDLTIYARVRARGAAEPGASELHELTNFLPCERLYASSVRGNRRRPARTG